MSSTQPVPEPERFRAGERAKLVTGGIYEQNVYIVTDDGGPTVRVRWTGARRYVGGPHGPRRVLVAYPKTYERNVRRERLEKRS